jgi:uncharacterized protein YraI
MSVCVRSVAAIVLFAGLWGTGVVQHAGAGGWIDVGGVAVVATTEGDVLALREGPGTSYGALTAFAAGTELSVLDGPVTGDDGALWYQVAGGGLVGWCAAAWLAPPAASSGTSYIGGSDGGVNLRDEPTLSGAILLIVPEGGAVVQLGANQYADGITWALVRYGTTTGWLASGFLGGVSAGSGGAPAPAPVASASVPGIVIGGNAQVVGTDGYDLRIRDGIGLGAPIFSVVPSGAVITIVNGPLSDETGAPWYGIDFDGVFGWVLGEHLSPTGAAPSRRFQSGNGMMNTYSSPPVVSNPARGQAVVAEALRYLGVPYVWGGATPAGWDCSGMIQWIYANAASVALPRVAQDQFLYGATLRPDQLEAGDLVFFFDTDGPGITHNGISLGDDRFIHANGEADGTVISSLYTPYWAAHYAGARRP